MHKPDNPHHNLTTLYTHPKNPTQYASLLLFLLRLPAIRPARPPGYRRRRPLLQPMLKLLGQGLSLAARSVLFRVLLLALSSAEVARVGGPSDVAAHQVTNDGRVCVCWDGSVDRS